MEQSYAKKWSIYTINKLGSKDVGALLEDNFKLFFSIIFSIDKTLTSATIVLNSWKKTVMKGKDRM